MQRESVAEGTARTRADDVAHICAAGAGLGQADVARFEPVIGQGFDLGFQGVGVPGKSATVQDDVVQPELSVTTDARRIDLGIGDRTQADMRRVRTFHRMP